MRNEAPLASIAKRGAIASGLLAVMMALAACGEESVTGPRVEACEAPPYFTVLPVPAARITSVPVVGGVDAPGHVTPTDHGAFFLDGADIPLVAPADLVVTELRSVRYSGPGLPPGGLQDYAVFFRVCSEVSAWFGHVGSLVGSLSAGAVDYRDCQSYSTGTTDVVACTARDPAIEVRAGALLGSVSGAVDFGVVDTRVTNVYIRPAWFSGGNHAVCMWEYFDDANRTLLFSKLLDPARPGIVPTGDPRCGTMEVDVASTAKGLWAEPGVTAPLTASNERGLIALVDYPYRPQMELALSLGPTSLGARLAIVERQTSGRVNRAFEEVTPDGQIYCYGPPVANSVVSSWFLQLESASTLRMERVDHGVGGSPCSGDPATWAFGAAAVTLVR